MGDSCVRNEWYGAKFNDSTHQHFTDPCQVYNWLNETSRSSLRVIPKQQIKCDTDIQPSWYRFGGTNNNYILRTTCIQNPGACQTLSPGWMLDSHPTKGLWTYYWLSLYISYLSSQLIIAVFSLILIVVFILTFVFSFYLTNQLQYQKYVIKAFQTVNRDVCFYSYFDCCYLKIPIQVKNCRTFMVYRLNSTAYPFACARYCTVIKGIIWTSLNKMRKNWANSRKQLD